jgi:hypothetical protein
LIQWMGSSERSDGAGSSWAKDRDVNKGLEPVGIASVGGS